MIQQHRNIIPTQRNRELCFLAINRRSNKILNAQPHVSPNKVKTLRHSVFALNIEHYISCTSLIKKNGGQRKSLPSISTYNFKCLITFDASW